MEAVAPVCAAVEAAVRSADLGVPPLRVDLVTAIDGVTWKTGWDGKKRGEYDDIKVWFLGRREFVANKRATGRRKDLADLEALGEDDGKP